MAASPQWKVYTASGEYIAACKHPQFAAMVLAGFVQRTGFSAEYRMGRSSTRGATIRFGHRQIVWTEGVDGCAAESYDVVAEKAFENAEA